MDNKNKILANEIESFGRGYLRALHINFGFDFEKPCDIIRIDGSFTLGSVKKLLSARGYSAKHSNVAILLNRTEWGVCQYLRVAILNYDWDDFTIEFRRGLKNLSSYSTKSDFNTSRKCVRTEYTYSQYRHSSYRQEVSYDGGIAYVIAQDFKDGCAAAKQADYLYDHLENKLRGQDVIATDIRYKVIRNNGRSYDIADPRDRHSQINYYASSDEYAFDKSGFCVSARRLQLKNAAQALRDKRAHDAYAAVDTTAFIIAIDTALADAKQRLSRMFASAETCAEYKVFRDAFDGWHGFRDTLDSVASFKRAIEMKDFKDMEECTACFNRIIANLSNCGR